MAQLTHRLGSNNFGLITLFCLLAILPFTLTSGVDPRPAIGFDLGQSYGTAVAHLPNGTIIKLAKIKGSPRYLAFMQNELQKQTDFVYDERTRSCLLWEEILRLLNQYTGLGPTYGGAILAEMLTSLRIASEAILGAPLPATVVFTAPWMHAWSYEETLRDGLVEKARILAGLRPVMIENMDSVYLSETNTVLAANGRQICPHLRCNGPEFSDEFPITNKIVYFVSFTNHSLYTSFQLATCFFLSATSNRLGTINPEFGLNQQEHASDKESFWRKLQDYLVSQAREYVISGDYSLRQHCILLIAGEAADDAQFMDTVRQAIARIQNDPVHRSKEAKAGLNIELLVSQDLTYAAATGAAFWRRTMIDPSYCEGNEASMRKTDRDEL